MGMRENLEGGYAEGLIFRRLLMAPETKTLAGNLTLVVKSMPVQYLDPGGASRTITLPAEASSEGLVFLIVNTANNAEDLTVQSDAPATVTIVGQNEMALLVCDGTTWRALANVIADSVAGADVAVVADANTQGGIPVLHRIAIADGSGDTDVVLAEKTRVIDAWAVKTAANGGAGDTVQVKNGANAITDALDLNVSDGVVVRAGSIDDAQHEIAATGTLKVTAANATDNTCIVYVLGVKVA